MLAIHFPTSPIVESHSPSPFSFPSSPAHHHHQQQTFSPLSFAPLPLQKKSAARPKLSLKITAADTRTFGSKSSSALKAPLTAGPLSPNALATMRNTQMNARRPTGEVPQLSMPAIQSFSSSSSSSSDECSTPVDDDDMHSEMKEKSRKRRFQRASHSSRELLVKTSHPVAPSAIPYNIELPAPQPSKRATNPSARRVHFAEAHIVIPAVSVLVTETYDSADESSSDDSSDSEAEEAPVRTVMEQMAEINKLKSKVEAMDMIMQTPNGAGEKEEKVGGECSSWMFRLGKIEYDEISKQEASEQCSTPVGFGFGSGIKF